MKRIFSIVSIFMLALVLVSCGGDKPTKKTVKLDVWASDLDQDFTKELVEEFKVHYKDQADFEISVSPVSEADTKDEVLKDIEAAADVFAFADDQLNDLLAAGALQEVLEDTNGVITANGGKDSGAINAASRDGKLYAYPMTADNGYFLFYDKSVYSAEDVKTLDGILAKSKEKNTKFTMDIADSWYIYSFFQGAGLEMYFDGEKNISNWNTAPEGVKVLQSIINVSAHEGYEYMNNAGFMGALKNGTVSAGVNGVWNADVAEEAWGENYAATKLPTFTYDGKQVQMSSFAGYKLVGVNNTSKETGWAMKLANWLTNESSQIKRFEKRGLGPSNVAAASDERVKSNPAISALAQQSEFATVQNVGPSYWDPAAALGANVAEKILNKQSTVAELQAALDLAVAGITTKPIS